MDLWSGTGQTRASSVLSELINWEQQGIPTDAGTSASQHFDLARMRRLLGRLGDPHRQVRAVHVAGSKGKGSTVALISQALRAAGHRVGVYTSPHLNHIGERVAVLEPGSRSAGTLSLEAFESLARAHEGALRGAQSEEAGALSHFEAVTALAFRHFADEAVDVAVVETGLGGLTDATNVIEPEQLQVAIITAIGLEHADALGGSLRSIAAAKAGIMKAGRPVVLALQPHAEVEEILLQHAAALGCPVVRADEAVSVSHEGFELEGAGGVAEPPAASGAAAAAAAAAAGPGATSGAAGPAGDAAAAGSAERGAAEEGSMPHALSELLSVRGAPGSVASGLSLDRARCALVGRHQHDNVAGAVSALCVLRGGPGGDSAKAAWAVPDEAIGRGVGAAWLPCRFEVRTLPGTGSPPLYAVLDGAHTRAAAVALSDTLSRAFPAASPATLVLAMAGDKDVDGVVAELRAGMAASMRCVVFTAAHIGGSGARSAAPGALAARWQADTMLHPSPAGSIRVRQLIQASLGAALNKARHELSASAGTSGPALIVVTGSLHAAAAAGRELLALEDHVR
ncbi:hypothetical protein FOA52_015206 [Chlamydomonas sp. UWO 241]|nr:hypothetical protein FOA52_015206 [Chlamydomonas sp. UWO 241]